MVDKQRVIRIFDKIIYWSIIILPFTIAIAKSPMNIFMGLLIVAFLIKKILKKETLFIPRSINLALLTLFLVTCLSSINSIALTDTLKGGIFKLLRYILILFVLAQEIKDTKHIKRIITSIFLGLTLISVDSIWQVFTGRDFIRGYSTIINLGLVRATASFSDANNLGIYLSAFAPIVFAITLYCSKIRNKMLMLVLSILTLSAIALTYSRPTLLAVFIALIILALVRKNKALGTILIVFVLIVPFLLPRSFKEWAKTVDNNPVRIMFNDDRIAIYRNSMQMIKANPIIGVGANTFMKNYKYYKEQPEYRGVVTSDYIYAHNNFLHMAGEIGLLGIAAFLWFLINLSTECTRIYKAQQDRFLKIVALALSLSLIAFLINGLAESSLYYSRVAVIFWYLVGLNLALKRCLSKKSS